MGRHTGAQPRHGSQQEEKLRLRTFRYKFQTQVGAEDKVATLSDADNVWTEIRHMHMREAIDKLMADFNQFLQDNAGFKGYVMACVSTDHSIDDAWPSEMAQRA